MSPLPLLGLSLHAAVPVRERWLAACGRFRPDFYPYKKLSGADARPLYLWTDGGSSIALPGRIVTVDGQDHYVPPAAQRGRLARGGYIR